MDRILRPTGFVIVRDRQPIIQFIQKHLTAMHWELVAGADAEPNLDSGEDAEKVLLVQKKLWLIDDDESAKDETA